MPKEKEKGQLNNSSLEEREDPLWFQRNSFACLFFAIIKVFSPTEGNPHPDQACCQLIKEYLSCWCSTARGKEMISWLFGRETQAYSEKWKGAAIKHRQMDIQCSLDATWSRSQQFPTTQTLQEAFCHLCQFAQWDSTPLVLSPVSLFHLPIPRRQLVFNAVAPHSRHL